MLCHPSFRNKQQSTIKFYHTAPVLTYDTNGRFITHPLNLKFAFL